MLRETMEIVSFFGTTIYGTNLKNRNDIILIGLIHLTARCVQF